MKVSAIFALTISVFIATATLGETQEVSISISNITANQRISGYITELPAQDYQNYKVIVYVHTDKWYIHPYAGQGDGKSWASIKQNGKWQIETVQREFRADRIAAILVKRNYPEPSKVESLEQIQRTAIIVKELRGTPDYGKL